MMMRRLSFLSRFKISQTCQLLVFLLFSGFSTLSLISFNLALPRNDNWIGEFGGLISYSLIWLFGLGAWAIPCFLWWLTLQVISKTNTGYVRKKMGYFLMLLLSSNFLLSIPDTVHIVPEFLNKKIFTCGNHYCLGGVPFHIIYSGETLGTSFLSLKKLLGTIGSTFLFSLLWTTAFIKLTSFCMPKRLRLPIAGLKKFSELVLKKKREFIAYIKALCSKKQYLLNSDKTEPIKIRVSDEGNKNPSFSKSFEPPHPQNRGLMKPVPKEIARCNEKQTTISDKESKDSLPKHTLLSKSSVPDRSSIQAFLAQQSLILKDTLSKFGIEVTLGAICSGPTLTAFEVLPQAGVKVQKIKALESDIALNLQASSIRIIAPIPGKAAVGIEIPNPKPETVVFRDLLESYLKQNQDLNIPLLLGKKANGDNLWTDLAMMPHLIIAGTTGSGKSVCINTIIMSMIMTKSPTEIRLVIIDPKKVELTGYSNLPHMLTPVITEAPAAHNSLVWLVKEMEKRYEILRHLGLRNIQAFNNRVISAKEVALNQDIPDKFPFIVGIIDELADLFLSSSQDMETPIIRIAQMARAVGIHMILATQRPSREVITGLIKANFPSRIAFKVSSRVNSQIIIDEPGAENLIGNGDMLLVIPNHFGPIRAQGAYVKDEDINKVIADLCQKFQTEYIIPSFENSIIQGKSGSHRDPLFQEAAHIVTSTGNASTTFLQRKLKIGYARAASLIDELETTGLIGPSEGSKPRRVIGKMDSQPLD